MRTYIWAATLALFCFVPAGTLADDDVKPEQLRKMYDDALAQLKAAQDRKAELAKENEALTAKVQDLQKQLAAAQEQTQALKRELADDADKTFFLRSYHAAWQRFLVRNPDTMGRWKVYLGFSLLALPSDINDLRSFDFADSRAADREEQRPDLELQTDPPPARGEPPLPVTK